MSQPVAGRYEIDDPPVPGGMGEVHTAYDPRLDRRVVVKRMRRDLTGDAEMTKRFEREARFTARVSHPGIPRMLDYGIDDQGPYLILEYVEGCDLNHLIDTFGPLPASWVAAIGAQVCAVLDHTHAASLIHRDLTPGNILLCPDGTVAIIDFGVASVIGASRLSTLTALEAVVGTASHQAPERRLGAASPLTDLYSVGCVLRQLGAVDPTTHLGVLVGELTASHPQDRPDSARSVANRLLPLIGVLDPLPGVVPDTHGLSARIAAFTVATPTRPEHPEPQAALADLSYLRRRAERLAQEGRLRQALELLDLLVDTASAAGDPLLLDLHWDRVLCLADAGLSHRLAEELTPLCGQLAERLGVRHPAATSARLMLAQAESARGRVREALAVLRSLLTDLTGVDPAGVDPAGVGAASRLDPRLDPVRLEYGIQLAVAGQLPESRQVLSSLADDQRERLGPHHPDVTATIDVLSAL